MQGVVRIAMGLVLGIAGGGVAAAQDVARGKALVDQCLACHTLSAAEEPGPGPTLAGVAGARAATRPDFEYSDAFLAAGAKGLVWTDAALSRFLANPQGEVPKNKMAFQGIANEGERADIVAYLKTLR
jgi:cytochrome c